MDPVMAQFQYGWVAHAQSLAINQQLDNRAMTAAVAASLMQADDPVHYAGLNTAVRTPSTIEHPLYPGAAK